VRYGEQSGFFDIYSLPYEVKANEATDMLFTNYCNLYPQLSFPYASADDFYYHPAFRDYAKRYMTMERYEKMQLQGLVWIITSYFMKHAHLLVDDTDERVLRVVHYVRDNIAENITLEKMADVGCVAKSHLSRLFHKAFGISPMQYVTRNKIQYSQWLLLSSEMSIGDVAKSVGISDVSYFIRLFRKNIGFTPQDYRESLRY